ncbi:cytochrome b-c1 complex subunit 6, mitochondrial-like [Lotus japonicus]|uniref:cytochrome b-c1 complex subunit 6, mitochondrial-like n=1 Tax=Lotus japonicus TaxID=34305 RepID=UPI002584F954|nr:cytochrome b-c1 complex subunit 6, mitochondrial-like [Lotus japonicus]
MKKKPFTYKSEGGSNLDKSNITCFECKKPGHIKPDCPRLAKKSGKKPFYKKKKALTAGWDESEDDSEDDDEDEDDDALFALMASAESSDDEDDDEVKFENLKEDFNELLEHSYALSEKYKTLKKQFAKLQLEHEKVLIKKDHVVKENTALKEQDSVKEVTTLKKKELKYL